VAWRERRLDWEKGGPERAAGVRDWENGGFIETREARRERTQTRRERIEARLRERWPGVTERGPGEGERRPIVRELKIGREEGVPEKEKWGGSTREMG